MAEIITRRWKKGKCVAETREETDWEPNAADLDRVTVSCACGNTFDMPRDALAFGVYCGQCGEPGKMKVVADPAS